MMKRIACSIVFSAFCLLGFFASARAGQNYVVNGTTYTFPDVDDVDWGQNVTDWAGAVTVGLSNAQTDITHLKTSTQTLKSRVDTLSNSTSTIAATLLQVQADTATLQSRCNNLDASTASIISTMNGLALGGTTNIVVDLVISSHTSDPTNIFTVDARAIEVMGNRFVNISTQCAMNKTGPGGTDFSEVSSTWYAVYMVCDSTGSRYSVILSTNQTQPYLGQIPWATKWNRIAWMRNDGSSNLIQVYLHDRNVTFTTQMQLLEVGDVSGQNTLDLSSVVPPGADTINLSSRITGENLANSFNLLLYPFGVNIDVASTNEGAQNYMIATASAGSIRNTSKQNMQLGGNRSLIYEDAATVGELIIWAYGYTF